MVSFQHATPNVNLHFDHHSFMEEVGKHFLTGDHLISVFHSCCIGPVNFLLCPHLLYALYIAGVKSTAFAVTWCLTGFSVEGRNNLCKKIICGELTGT